MPRKKIAPPGPRLSVRHPIRIVPLHVPEHAVSPLAGAPAAPPGQVARGDQYGQPLHPAGVGAPPKLTYRGGPLLTNVEVITLFWGDAWQKAPAQALVDPTHAFFDFVLTSALMHQLSEYNTDAYKIGQGKRIATFTVVAPPLAQSLTDVKLREMLQQQISGTTTFPQPTANPL